MIDWAGVIKREQAFVVNAAMDSGLLEVEVYNPEAPDRFWADNDRLDEVLLEYRRVGDLSWRAAKLADGSDADFAGEESTFGYAKLDWHVSSIPDGNYEIRTSTHCKPAGLDPPEGINEARSTAIVGVFDRVAPKMFSHAPEPSDGVFNAGDKIAVEFTETIDCSRPFSFDVVVSLGPRMIVRKNALDIVCEGRTLEISLVNRFSASTLEGSAVNVTLSGMQDLAKNVMNDELTWKFVFEEDAAAIPANVILEGVLFNIPYNSSWDNTSSTAYTFFVSTLQQDLADMLGVVAQERVLITRAIESPGRQTLVTIVFTPPASTQTARRRAVDSDASAEELAFLFLSLFEGSTTETAGNETDGNETDGSEPFGNSSLLSLMDTSSPPTQRVEQAAVAPEEATTTTSTSKPEAERASGSTADTDDSKALATVILIFVIVVVMQGCILLWLMCANRVSLSRLSMMMPALTSKSQTRVSPMSPGLPQQHSRGVADLGDLAMEDIRTHHFGGSEAGIYESALSQQREDWNVFDLDADICAEQFGGFESATYEEPGEISSGLQESC
jgi:hypothetical protein